MTSCLAGHEVGHL